MGPLIVAHRLPLLASLLQLQLQAMLRARHPAAAVDLILKSDAVHVNVNRNPHSYL